MSREQLQPRRPAITFNFQHSTLAGGVQRFTATIGFYDGGRPAEAFLNSSQKLDTDIDVNARDAAILLSLALQYGAPLRDIQASLTRGANGEPQGVAGSLCDAFVREARR